jgi:hypothetical protein
MYDRQTKSLWSQLLREAVTGPMTGSSLPILEVVNTTWKDWKKEHPDTLVLDLKTGYRRPYRDDDPYKSLKHTDRGLGVIVGDRVKIYPFDELKRIRRFPLQDEVAGQQLLVYFDKKTKNAQVADLEGQPVEFFTSFLYVLKDFSFGAEFFEANR